MKRHKKIRLIVEISLLVALAISLSYIDKMISTLIFPTLPGAKIGFSNFIVLFAICNYRFRESIIVALLKSVVAGLILSGITTFIIGGTATLVSFLLMYFANKYLNQKISMVGISLIGGFSHTLTQLIVVMLIYDLGYVVFSYGLSLIAISLVTSIIIGLVTIRTNQLYQNSINTKE